MDQRGAAAARTNGGITVLIVILLLTVTVAQSKDDVTRVSPPSTSPTRLRPAREE
jgi:hypothetical protein